MKFLQKLGKALMLPVACLPICGLLMGLGYMLCPAAMQGGKISGAVPLIGLYLVKAGSALIDHIAVLFVIGVGVGMAEKNDGTAALSAIASWLMITTLLSQDTVATFIPKWASNEKIMLAFSKIENPFIGIIAGLIGAICYNKFKNVKLPDYLSFFSGKRCVAIISGFVSIIVSIILLGAWPLLFTGLVALGKFVVSLDAVGTGIYAFLNRLLIPTGLHHALNNVFWFDTIGLGDLSHYWAGETSKQVSWSLGMYMSGFFPCMMFGVPGASIAMIRSAKSKNKKIAIGLLGSGAICAFLCGVTEPFEFAFMFLAPILYFAYSLLYGIVAMVTVMLGFRAGFCFSGGVTDLIFSSSLPAASKTWLIIPIGIVTFIVFYVVFRFLIVKLNLKTPGREDEETDINLDNKELLSDANNKYYNSAKIILEGLGGKSNIVSLDNCVTRLRLELNDINLIDEKKIKSANAKGIIKTGKNGLQIVIGTMVEFVAEEMGNLLNLDSDTSLPDDLKEEVEFVDSKGQASDTKGEEKINEIFSPIKGKVVPIKDVPDETFSSEVLGKGVAIIPSEGVVYAPIDGTVEMIPDTKHAIAITTENGIEILIHIGINTVSLNGKPYEILVSEGDKFKKGDVLMKFDMESIEESGLPTISPIVITNSDECKDIKLNCGELELDNVIIKTLK